MIDPSLDRYRKRQAGMAYVVLLALLAIMTTLGLAFAFKVGIETSATETRSDGMQAQYLAEAAVNHAMWRLLNEETTAIEYRVSHDDDDASEEDDGDMRVNDFRMELGNWKYGGVRFLNVNIPPGAVITDAYIRVRSYHTHDEHTDLTIRGENSDDAARFTTTHSDISNRTQTAAAVTWNDLPKWTMDEFYRTPNLSAIIQEIVDRPGWSSGNAMAILFESTDPGGKRCAYSHDDSPADAAILYIHYGDASIAAGNQYYMHTLAGGRYGYKIRRHTDTTFATIATVGAIGENVVQQSYVLYVLPGCKPGSFRDEFTSAAYDNSDGSLAWAGDWIELDSSGAGPSAGKVVITGGELRMRGTPSGDDPSLAREVDLSGHLYATLSFSFRTGGGVEAGEDSAVVEISGDGGGSWTVLGDFIDAGGSAAGTRSYDISAYIAENTQVRFRINLLYGGPDEYFYVDDVEIEAICERTLCDNLVGYWRLDESIGSASAWDSSGNEYHGALEDMDPSTDWVTGHLEGALDFDGVNDHIDLSVMNPRNYDDFTISAWYRSTDTSVSDDEYIFYHNFNYEDEIVFGPTDDQPDRLRLGININNSWNGYYGTSDIVDQQWHHLVAVRGGGRIKIYVDGVEETDDPDGDSGQTVSINGAGPFIGDCPGITEQVHGILDGVRIYNRALDPDEIVRLYELTEGGCGSPINNAPFVDAGPDQSLPGPAVKTILDGMVADDGLPDPPKALTTTWSQVSGPGTVIFDDASAINTVAVIPQVGLYTLRLTADDGELETFDDVAIELSISCNGTYVDRFNNPVFNGSNGTLDWSASPWEEVGESDGPTSGDIQVTSDLGSNRLRLKDNDNGGEGVERQVDLSGATSTKLVFYYRRSGLDNSNDYVKVEISANGATGPWTELFRFQGPGTDSAYQIVEVDISAYASSNTRLRFLTSPKMGGNDIVWIDDVYMNCGS